jgi:hypothetical protein
LQWSPETITTATSLLTTTSETTSSSNHQWTNQQEQQPFPTSRRTQVQQQLSTTTKTPDGFFNNVPIYFRDGSTPTFSSVHCVGETHHVDTAWMYRSCHYSHFCFDTNTSDFVILRSPAEKLFSEQRQIMNTESNGIYISSSLSMPTSNNLQVAVGGINPRWMGKGHDKGIHKVKWSPRILDIPPPSTTDSPDLSFYELPDHVVLIPFHSFAAHNIGHLLWDDLLPIFTLLSMFDLVNRPPPEDQQPYQHLLLRKVMKHALYASCEKRPKLEQRCQTNLERFLPAMGIDPQTYSTTKQYRLQLSSTTASQSASSPPRSSSLICAKHGVAGIGMLTDHGLVDHGWVYGDMKHPHNHGRGPLLAQFRSYLVHNLGFSRYDNRLLRPPHQIVFSTNSSRNEARQLLFQKQIVAVKNKFSLEHVVMIKNVTMSQLSLKEQVQMALQTTVFITACGGGAVTAMFLPKGATLIVYYPESGGFHFPTSNYTKTPALLDWDLFNNLAHLHVHWFPIGTMDSMESIETLIHLLQLELHSFDNQHVM